MNTQHYRQEIMKKAYIAPEAFVVEIENDTNLMSASFNDGTGSIGKDDNGGYSGDDALSREDKPVTPNLWEQGW